MHELVFAAPPLLATAWASVKLWTRKTRRGQGLHASAALGFAPLPAADGRRYSMDSFRDHQALVVVFMSNRCPGVKAYDNRLRQLQEDYWHRGVQVIGINPIDAKLYPDEGLAGMAKAAEERNIVFPYLKDDDQNVARIFDAQCTPHAFVLDERRHVRYSGKIDDAFLEANARRHYVRDALESVLLGKPVSPDLTAPLGCTIDWSTPRHATGSAIQRSPLHVTTH